MRVEEGQLKLFLVDSGLVKEDAIKRVEAKAKQTGKKFEEVLLNEGLVSQEDLIRLKAYILGIPFINLEKEIVPKEVLEIIPEPIARAHNIVAFRKKGKDLEVAMLDPEDLQTIEFIKKKSNLRILPRLTTPESIKNVLAQYRKTLGAEFAELIKKEAEGVKTKQIKEETTEKEELEKIAQEIPVIKIVDSLLKHAVLDRASDIHIEPMEKEVLVRYRIDGVLRDAMTLPKQVAPGIVARIKVLSNLKLDEHRLPQDGRFKFETNGDKYSVRVSILPVLNGEKVVMRLLAEEAKGYSLEELGLRGKALEDIQTALRRPTGMILVCGPTGSGKTTTLYSMIEILNTPEVNISTIEDPIEYRMPRVNQTQVRPDIGLTFANGLRALLRQDPDIIMVGEIRDNETAALAVNAALTGHLVLSTLHTNNAAGAIPRLIDMKVEPFLIASTLNVILAQRLVRRLCEGKKEYHLNESQIEQISKYCDLKRVENILKEEGILKKKGTIKDVTFFEPKPTKACPEGYKGRIGIFEVLPVTESIKKLITQNATSDAIQERALKEGMITMVEDGFVKAAQGITTIEEVLRVIME
ncbi:type II/IV secretion system protein [bacterium]|nr:type II/IV secretion system protein [bacterium]